MNGSTITCSKCVKNLGNTFDSSLSFKGHMLSVSRPLMLFFTTVGIYFHFSRTSFETAIYAFVTSCLDYFNFFLAGFPASSLQSFQFVQKFFCRLWSWCSKFFYNTHLLRNYFFFIKLRFHYKIFSLHKIFCCPSSAYLSFSITRS